MTSLYVLRSRYKPTKPPKMANRARRIRKLRAKEEKEEVKPAAAVNAMDGVGSLLNKFDCLSMIEADDSVEIEAHFLEELLSGDGKRYQSLMPSLCTGAKAKSPAPALLDTSGFTDDTVAGTSNDDSALSYPENKGCLKGGIGASMSWLVSRRYVSSDVKSSKDTRDDDTGRGGTAGYVSTEDSDQRDGGWMPLAVADVWDNVFSYPSRFQCWQGSTTACEPSPESGPYPSSAGDGDSDLTKGAAGLRNDARRKERRRSVMGLGDRLKKVVPGPGRLMKDSSFAMEPLDSSYVAEESKRGESISGTGGVQQSFDCEPLVGRKLFDSAPSSYRGGARDGSDSIALSCNHLGYTAQPHVLGVLIRSRSPASSSVRYLSDIEDEDHSEDGIPSVKGNRGDRAAAFDQE